ncbi:MAG: sugar transporter subunit [Glaciihabitans sp.]|jgi:PTS system mannitol-specific IIA component|nr:sugar transporter subunit [Glaciihabitans sp.]MDQ1570911.1 mannitol system component [Actinomycetota bacterium]
MSPTLSELEQLLPDSSILLSVVALSRDDAIRQAGDLLVAAGSVEPDYVVEMLGRERAVSTFVGEGIAMPHGTLTAKSDVLVEGLSLLRLAEPVDWGGEPVTIVIGIAAHGRRYITLLSQLATALLDEGRAEALRSTDSVDQVRRILSS